MIFTNNGKFIAHRIEAAALFTFTCKLAKKKQTTTIFYIRHCVNSHMYSFTTHSGHPGDELLWLAVLERCRWWPHRLDTLLA